MTRGAQFTRTAKFARQRTSSREPFLGRQLRLRMSPTLDIGPRGGVRSPPLSMIVYALLAGVVPNRAGFAPAGINTPARGTPTDER